MANATLGDPWIIDTGSSTLATGHVKVRRVRWTGATTAGHVAILTDTAGLVKWTSEASGANYAEESAASFSCTGLKVTTLGSGKLYLYMG